MEQELNLPAHILGDTRRIDAKKRKGEILPGYSELIRSYLKELKQQAKRACQRSDEELLKAFLNSGKVHVKIFCDLDKRDYDRLNNWQHGKTKVISPDFLEGIKKKILERI